MTARDAERVSREFSIVERARMRETLSRIRDAGDEERRESLRLLVESVRAPVTFPVPIAHDEDTCAFRALERYEPAHIAAAIEKLVDRERLLPAAALCHFSPEYRAGVWDALPSSVRGVTRPLLAQVPSIGHARTRRYAQDLAKRVASDAGAPRPG